jgi:AmmeMemoRadiSam system protein B
LEKCAFAERDTAAHEKEHSIEVHLPFLQYHKKSFDFVPIILGEPDLKRLRELGSALASCVKGKDILLIASTDLTHYEQAEAARAKDSLVLSAIEKLDPEKLYSEISENDISMCGWMPVYTLLHACRELGAKEGRIIKYMNSGDTSGDFSEVVGYGGAIII